MPKANKFPRRRKRDTHLKEEAATFQRGWPTNGSSPRYPPTRAIRARQVHEKFSKQTSQRRQPPSDGAVARAAVGSSEMSTAGSSGTGSSGGASGAASADEVRRWAEGNINRLADRFEDHAKKMDANLQQFMEHIEDMLTGTDISCSYRSLP